MDHLIIRAGVVQNIVYDLDRPAGYKPTSDIWVPRTGDTADVQIGWSYDGETFAAPPAEPAPAPASTAELQARIADLETELAAVKAALPTA